MLYVAVKRCASRRFSSVTRHGVVNVFNTLATLLLSLLKRRRVLSVVHTAQLCSMLYSARFGTLDTKLMLSFSAR